MGSSPRCLDACSHLLPFFLPKAGVGVVSVPIDSAGSHLRPSGSPLPVVCRPLNGR
jgi:hypothetical protein